ncbi:hypothetical protein J7J95_03200, partial [bacterium]|nr:hypothetical protein [bacterium]
QINYENTAQTSKWPGGDYKNYLRLFVPLGTELGRVIVYDPLVGKQTSRQLISRGEINQERYQDKMSFGFLVTVPINSRRTVEINYSRRVSWPEKTVRYLLFWQKQSGMGATPLTVLMELPQGAAPLQVTPAATITEKGLVFSEIIKKDIPFAVEFSYQ